MFNLIKTELYRVIRMRSYAVLIIVSALMGIFMMWMLNIDMSEMEETNTSYSQPTEYSEEAEPVESFAAGFSDGFNESIQESEDSLDDSSIGIVVEADPSWGGDGFTLSNYMESIVQSGMLLLIISIFAAIYVYAEQKTGYIKNIAGQLTFRGFLGISKLAGIAVQSLTMFAVFTVSSLIAGNIIVGEKFVIGDISNLRRYLIITVFMHFAFAVLISMLCIIARSSAFGMVAGILVSSGVVSIIYIGINYLINKISFLENFDISEFALETQSCQISMASDTDSIVRAVITGLIYLVITTAVSAVVVQKRDVR